MLTYQEALDYIYSFIDYERSSLEGPHRFDLSRITALLELLGQPHRRYKAVHIAGTKGKGSTAAMTESILRTAGYKTGLFTSPHLHSYRERIQTGGQLITEKRLAAHVERLIPLAERFSGLTTFEITTALAFSYFAGGGHHPHRIRSRGCVGPQAKPDSVREGGDNQGRKASGLYAPEAHGFESHQADLSRMGSTPDPGRS